MSDLYLIEYAYRSLNFLDFLNNSLKNWDSVSNNKNLFLSEKQTKFNEINNDNLFKYLKNERENENCPKNINNYKINIIQNWAKSNKINLSKNFSFEELYNLSDKIFIIYKTELDKLISEKNQILNLCFPQLIKNLFSIFYILNEIKKIFLEEKNSEYDKYTKILLECEEKSKLIESYIKNEKNLKKTFNKEKKVLNEKITNLLEENNKIKKNLEDSQNELKNIENYKQGLLYSNNDLFITNERLQSEYLGLLQEMDTLKSKIEAEKKEREEQMEAEKKEREQQMENMKNEIEKERSEKQKFMNKIKNYFEEMENLFHKQKEDFTKNFLEKK